MPKKKKKKKKIHVLNYSKDQLEVVAQINKRMN